MLTPRHGLPTMRIWYLLRKGRVPRPTILLFHHTPAANRSILEFLRIAKNAFNALFVRCDESGEIIIQAALHRAVLALAAPYIMFVQEIFHGSVLSYVLDFLLKGAKCRFSFCSYLPVYSDAKSAQGIRGNFFHRRGPRITIRGSMEEGKFREPAFCVKSRFPSPPAKTLIYSR